MLGYLSVVAEPVESWGDQYGVVVPCRYPGDRGELPVEAPWIRSTAGATLTLGTVVTAAEELGRGDTLSVAGTS